MERIPSRIVNEVQHLCTEASGETMPLSLRPDMPAFIADENGHIPMYDETANWLVIVTHEALEYSATIRMRRERQSG